MSDCVITLAATSSLTLLVPPLENKNCGRGGMTREGQQESRKIKEYT